MLLQQQPLKFQQINPTKHDLLLIKLGMSKYYEGSAPCGHSDTPDHRWPSTILQINHLKYMRFRSLEQRERQSENLALDLPCIGPKAKHFFCFTFPQPLARIVAQTQETVKILGNVYHRVPCLVSTVSLSQKRIRTEDRIKLYINELYYDFRKYRMDYLDDINFLRK